MNRFQWVFHFYYALAGFLAIICLIAAFTEPPPTDSPSASPGFYAAFIVLCVTSIAVLETLRSSESLRQKLVGAGVGVGVTVSAYLWLADESNVHPADLGFLGAFAFVWLLAAGLLLFFFLLILFTRFNNRSG